MSEPAATRRESVPAGPGATRREGQPAQTRREPVSGWSAVPRDLLPEALAARLSDPRLLATRGGEAHLLRVKDSACSSGERVLKVYFPQIEPDPVVWAQLVTVRSKHIVDVVETGTLADGRLFELMEYLPDGSLREAGAGRKVFDTATITEYVRQLAAGLEVLHDRGITHRDLKPDNVLCRGTDLLLSDFGLSRKFDASVHFTSVAMTPNYSAPETWAHALTQAADWWSLGIIVLELATGRRPFEGLDDRTIQKVVTTKPVPVDAIKDPRLNRLCAGLLVSDEKKRWNHEQVRDWLAGGAPHVPDRRVPIDPDEIAPFAFGGNTFKDPESLAAAMARDWRRAARQLGISPSPMWTAFTTWLHQFDDPDRYPPKVVEDRLDLLGRLERSKENPDAKLVRLLAGLNPKQPPIFRQAHIDAARLRQLARDAQDGPEGDAATKQAREIVLQLWEGKLLDELARFDGAQALGQIGARWLALGKELNAAVKYLKRDARLAPVFSGRTHRPVALAAMLELAAGAPRGDDWVHELAERGRALPEPVDWYGDLVAWAGTDPARAFAGLFASGVAQAEAQQVVIAKQAAEQARLARERAWADHERQRLDGRNRAIRLAVTGCAVLAGFWALVAAFSGALGPVLLVVAAHFVTEIILASEIAADYHPTYSLWQAVQEAMGRIGGRMRMSPGWWAAGIIGGLLLLGFASGLVPLAVLIAAAVHISWAVLRYRRWSAAHERDHQQVLSQ